MGENKHTPSEERDGWDAMQVFRSGAKALLAAHQTNRAQAGEITRLRAENAGMREAAQTALNALDTLAFVHDGNPSDAMADMPAVDYARHMLGEVRRSAKAAASDARSALSNATTPETGGEA